MEKTKCLAIHTVVVKGDFENFRAAFARSVLGVTFKKFKRRGRDFYQHRINNEKVTNNICNFLYEYLLKETQSMSNYDIRTDLTLHWDETGKIVGASKIKVSVFLRAAELYVDSISIQNIPEKIVIDVFYSEIDAASKKVRSKIAEIREMIGKSNLEVSEWNILEPKGREMAQRYNIKLAPTIMINANPKLIFENPEEKLIVNEIEDLYVPELTKSTPRLEKNQNAKTAIAFLFERQK